MNCPFTIIVSADHTVDWPKCLRRGQLSLEKVWRQEAHIKQLNQTVAAIIVADPHKGSGGVYRPIRDPHLAVLADCEILDKKNLIRELRHEKFLDEDPKNDAQILFAAYRKWGDNFVANVYGEFTMAIIDVCGKEVLAFSDAFGVRPCYFSHFKDGLILSTSIESIIDTGLVRKEPDQDALLDYLLFGMVQATDHARTCFKGLSALPASSKLSADIHKHRLEPIDIDGLHKIDEFKVITGPQFREEFEELFLNIIAERTENKDVKLLLSGGLDSGSLAVALCELNREGRGPKSAEMHTIIRGPNDPEAPSSKAVAKHLGFRHVIHEIDVRPSFDQLPLVFPSSSLYLKEQLRAHSEIAMDGGFLMTGLGFDQLLHPESYTFKKSFKTHGLFLTMDAVLVELRQTLMSALSGHSMAEFLVNMRRMDKRVDHDFYRVMPSYMDRDSTRYNEWEQRWNNARTLKGQLPSGHEWHRHPLHPLGQRSMLMMKWGQTPDSRLHPAYMRMSHPVLDLRLARYIWSLLPRPWFKRKNLLRLTFARNLPENVKYAPKRVISSKIEGTTLKQIAKELHPEVQRFVHKGHMSRETVDWSADLRPLLLSQWLRKVFT